MKKTFLAILIAIIIFSISFFSCKKETLLDSIGKSQRFVTIVDPSYDHVIYSWSKFGEAGGFLITQGNFNLSRAYLNYRPGSNIEPGRKKWYIEKVGAYVKFWYQDRGTVFNKWRVLDIDWRSTIDQGSVVIYTPNGDDNQYWEFIGEGQIFGENPSEAFKGVLVNKKTGKMLEIKTYASGAMGAVAHTNYKGSEEEMFYNLFGSFQSLSNKDRLWIICRCKI
ncbi:MAG: RICIN domain-containing protein [Solitalea-like symbiont of Acarus siro]